MTNSVSAALSGIGAVTVDHVGIAVPNLVAAIVFYTDTLGGELEHREHNARQRVDEAIIRFGRGPEAARIQLIAPSDEESTVAKFLQKRGAGLQQLALRVADLDAAIRTLQQRGIRLIYDEPQTGTGGSLITFIHPKDAGGVLLELVQAPA